jgi:hypothetical protein
VPAPQSLTIFSTPAAAAGTLLGPAIAAKPATRSMAASAADCAIDLTGMASFLDSSCM